MYTKAKENLTEAYGGLDNLPEEFTSIRPNFIEQLKKTLDMDKVEEQPIVEPEPEIITEVKSFFIDDDL